MPDSYARLYLHLVWATWDRVPALVGSIKAAAYRCVESECAALGVEILAIGGTADHVHLLIRLPRTAAIADIMKQAKGSSAHLVNHRPEEPEYIKWQKGYGAFTVSESHVGEVIGYIQHQEEHHRDRTTIGHLETVWEEKPPHPASDGC